MRPARQGALDGLCGLYAIINALEPAGVDAPRGSRLPHDMFRELTHGLGAVRLLAGMQDGLPVEDLVATTTLALHWLKAVHGFGLELSQPIAPGRVRSPRTFVETLRRYLDQPETAVVISYETGFSAHWTVALEVGSTHIMLRDSGGLSTLRIADFKRPGTGWRFRTADTLVLTRVS